MRICCEDWNCNGGNGDAGHVNTTKARHNDANNTHQRLVRDTCEHESKHTTKFCFQTVRVALKRTVIDKKLETSFAMLLRWPPFVRSAEHTLSMTLSASAAHAPLRRARQLSTALRSAAPHSAALRCATLRCATLQCATRRYVALRFAALRSAAPHATMLCCAPPRPPIILKTMLSGRRPTLSLIL